MFFFYVLIFAMPFYRHPLLDERAGAFTVVKYFGAVSSIFAVFYVLSTSIPNYLQSRQAKLFGAIFLLVVASVIRKGDIPLDGFSPFLSYISFVLFLFVIVSLVNTPQHLAYTLLVSIGSTAFASLYVVREFLKYRDVYLNFRPGYVVGDPNYFTLAAMLSLPIAYFWLINENRPLYRWAILIAMMPTSFAIAVSGSRGGLLALVVFVGFVVYRSRRRVRNLMIISVVLFVPMLLIPRNPVERLLHPDQSDHKAAQVRIRGWKAGLRMVQDHPLVGVGVGRYKPLVGLYAGDPNLSKIAHNTYLELAAEMGIPALLIYLWLLWETYRSLEGTRRLAFKMKAQLLFGIATGMQGGLISFLVSSFFLSAEYVKWLWFYVFMSIVIADVAKKWATRQQYTSATMQVHELQTTGATAA
jgi:O-antigen ligase